LTREHATDVVLDLFRTATQRTLDDSEFAQLWLHLDGLPQHVAPIGQRSIAYSTLKELLGVRTRATDSYVRQRFDRLAHAWLYAARPDVSQESTTRRVGDLLTTTGGALNSSERSELMTLIVDLPKEVRATVPTVINDVNVSMLLDNSFDDRVERRSELLRRWAMTVKILQDPTADKARNTVRAAELLDQPLESISYSDVEELAVLLNDLPEELRADGPTRILKDDLVHLVSFFGAEKAARRRLGMFAEQWKAHVDPARLAEVRASVERYLDGANDDAISQALSMGMWRDQMFDSIRAADGFEAALRGARALKHLHTKDELGSYKTILSEMQRGLDTPMPPHVQGLADATRGLIELNRERLHGRTPEAAVTGYMNNPDYTELGTVQTNIELLEAMLD
jgi:hypothetical protein